MNNWEKEQLRKKGYSEVAIWEIENHMNIELNKTKSTNSAEIN